MLPMEQLTNCENCGQLYIKNAVRDVCEKCYRQEEEAYTTVYKFIRQRVNRTATMQQVVDGTGVEEKLIIKFIKKGRIHVSQFPNLGYPCDRCGAFIQTGKLCDSCKKDINSQITALDREEERNRSEQKIKTYHAVKGAKGIWDK